jgi:hypothetical protein
VEWLPNGDVLFVMPYKGVYQVKEIVWSYGTPDVSHDADRLPNGNILMVWGRGDKPEISVQEVNQQGQVVWEWYPKDHLYDADSRTTEDGYTHSNLVIRLENGNILISVRNFDMLVEVDPQGEIV